LAGQDPREKRETQDCLGYLAEMALQDSRENQGPLGIREIRATEDCLELLVPLEPPEWMESQARPVNLGSRVLRDIPD